MNQREDLLKRENDLLKEVMGIEATLNQVSMDTKPEQRNLLDPRPGVLNSTNSLVADYTKTLSNLRELGRFRGLNKMRLF